MDSRTDDARGFLVLSKHDIAGLLAFPDYVDAVGQAFRRRAAGQGIGPDLLHLDAEAGEFHIKAGGFAGAGGRLAVKINGGFFANPSRYGLPAIQGVIVLSDAETGRPLACLESGEITVNRTGALAALAVEHLARPDASTATIIGCGRQARTQWLGLCHARRISTIRLVDASRDAAVMLAREIERDSAGSTLVEVVPFDQRRAATLASDIVVTCTPSRTPFVAPDDINRGALIVAVGADSPEKQELEPGLLAANRVVVDILDQCAAVGEVHHALTAGLMRREDVHAEIGAILAGRAAGRETAEEIIVFDTTGTALQDAAAASLAVDRALTAGIGTRIPLR
jgi:ornithine cyclodeaminase/alanine dehydrogenase